MHGSLQQQEEGGRRVLVSCGGRKKIEGKMRLGKETEGADEHYLLVVHCLVLMRSMTMHNADLWIN